MQAIPPLLPELESLWHEEKATPALRQREISLRELGFDLLYTPLERPTIGDDGALGRCQGADLAAAGPRADVLSRLLNARVRYRPLDPDLPAERVPVEEQGGVGVGLQLSALAA